MADLLECLLQIKGLHGTLERLAALMAGTPPDQWSPLAVSVLGGLGETEIVYGAAIRLMLTQPAPPLPPADRAALQALAAQRGCTPRRALERFATRRRDNLELLDGCSADDLSRIGMHPARRAMTLADLIAVMLAGDVECVGEIRGALLGSTREP
ncbi:MAG: hypothetical protein ACM3NQ_05220 [Bacteroidales bacterium]